MNYGLLVFGELDRDRLAAALADLFSVPAPAVDVADEGDNDRNWEAPVSCTVAPLVGDLHWYLDIYVGKAVASPPPVAVVAAGLAGRLRTVVAYEAGLSRPSAYWLVGPNGERTRARIYEEDADDKTGYRIDAVEHPLAALPGLPVAAIPEVIREHRMPTPATDLVRAQLAGPPGLVREVSALLGAWEGMVTRLTEGWPPDGWYPADYYREDLEIRNRLTAVTLSGAFTQALDEVDQRFIEATEDDGGRALVAATGPLPRDVAWWWRRITHPLPWRNAPGRAAAD